MKKRTAIVTRGFMANITLTVTEEDVPDFYTFYRAGTAFSIIFFYHPNL
jgi:hypothetical protein